MKFCSRAKTKYFELEVALVYAKQIGIDFQRVQSPIRLDFAMTISKSQGQMLDFVGVYLPSPVFSHGRPYVAMFRVKTPTSLRVLIVHNNDSNSIPNTTDDVVYQEVFQ
jgi:ATP-dependent exoDNAse (exonuclease V) alpha subunit